MATRLIQDPRIHPLNEAPPDPEGRYVLYWMQQSQRAEDNPALEYAIQRANDLALPVVVGFGLMDGYPEANARHYYFMLQGLAEVAPALERRNLRFVLRHGNPDAVALGLAADAALVVTDRGYLRHQKTWRRNVADNAGREVVEVETDVVVPVEVVSDKREYAARTLRPRFHKHLSTYLVELTTTPVDHAADGLHAPSGDHEDMDLALLQDDPRALLDRLDVDRSVPPVPIFEGGTRVAKRLFREFVEEHMDDYDHKRNKPQTDAVSHMSKYLHFGQVSPLWLALEIDNSVDKPENERDSYLEELLVRRELAMNFVHYSEDDYDSYTTLPDWAKKTLAEHADDEREHVYTLAELETADTHDPYWNAAMREMVHTGYMHNYMRMYWGKKILQWTNTPDAAFHRCLDLNNKYFLDGRDPNSYTGVAWCFGLHDRAWTERDVFGKIRYMSKGGLERKAKPKEYVDKVDRLVEEVEAGLEEMGWEG